MLPDAINTCLYVDLFTCPQIVLLQTVLHMGIIVLLDLTMIVHFGHILYIRLSAVVEAIQ